MPQPTDTTPTPEPVPPATNPNDAFRFFVYIVESPSAPDLYHRRSEGDLLARALDLQGIPSVARLTIDPGAFAAALKIGLPEAMARHPDRVPLLHLSAHGCADGIQLSSGDLMSWETLRALLVPINESLQGGLLLCMSACEGGAACRMAMRLGDDPHPYFGLVAHAGKPTWSDTAIAFSVFYHLCAKEKSIQEAVAAMNVASGCNGWFADRAETFKRSYVELMSKVDLSAAHADLAIPEEQDQVPPEAKHLESAG